MCSYDESHLGKDGCDRDHMLADSQRSSLFFGWLKGISESSFPLDGELIYGPVYTDSYVEIFPGPNYYHNYTSYIDNGILSI